MEGAIEKLLAAAKEVGGDAWPILVRQAYLTGMTGLIGASLALLAGIAAVVVGVRVRRKLETWDDPGAVIPVVLGCAAILMAVGFGLDSVRAVYFPEGRALVSLIDSVRP